MGYYRFAEVVGSLAEVSGKLLALLEASPEAEEILEEMLFGMMDEKEDIMRDLAARAIQEAKGDELDAEEIFLRSLDNDLEFQQGVEQPFLHLAIVDEINCVEAARQSGQPVVPPESLEDLVLQMVFTGRLVMWECAASTVENGWY